jgi:adenylate cyclase
MSDAEGAGGRLSQAEVARRVGVSPATLRRWIDAGAVPSIDGGWTPAAVAHARLVARLRERGHSLEEIRTATESGRLAFGYIEDLLPPPGRTYSLKGVAKETGLEPALVERLWSAMGLTQHSDGRFTEDDVQLLRYAAAMLAAGIPLVAFLQIARVYGHTLAQIADAEVRLFHLYVHEPLMRAGVTGMEMAEEMHGIAREILPLSSPMMDNLHRRFLGHFVQQDVIGHMESDEAEEPMDLGRLRVAIAFADLAGYTRLTEERGEDEAVQAVERFVEVVEHTLPEDARIIKTIGDEVMVVGHDPAALTEWAVDLQRLFTDPPLPRIGVQYGQALYRDGDYYGREVNLAARVVARSAGGEVVATRPIVEACNDQLTFDRIGEVRLKGFTEPTELFVARRSAEQ